MLVCCMCCCLSHKNVKTKNENKKIHTKRHVTRNPTSVVRQHRHCGKRTRLRPVQVMPAQFLIRSKAIWMQLTHVRCPLIQWKIWNRVRIIHFSTVTKQNQLWTTRIRHWPPPIRRKCTTTWPAAAVAAKSRCKAITTSMVTQKLKRNQCPASNRTDPTKSWGIFILFLFFVYNFVCPLSQWMRECLM